MGLGIHSSNVSEKPNHPTGSRLILGPESISVRTVIALGGFS